MKCSLQREEILINISRPIWLSNKVGKFESMYHYTHIETGKDANPNFYRSSNLEKYRAPVPIYVRLGTGKKFESRLYLEISVLETISSSYLMYLNWNLEKF